MVGLDTNVVVRYLTQDEPRQCQAVNDLFERTARSEEVAFLINPIVLAEAAWVLDSVYRYARVEIANALTLLLAVRQIQVEPRQAIKWALDAFASGEADFADYLISALNREQGCEATLTFDKKAAACAGFSLLTA
ncbi:MAG TPA: type II toxin-antitoxin system VapC family toxin [Burkholderiales bacterium]|nr:type II toxin-antitoxin system VapC family toxin [Burkholderiales bacterium]